MCFSEKEKTFDLTCKFCMLASLVYLSVVTGDGMTKPAREDGEEEANGSEILTEVDGETRTILDSWKSFTNSFMNGADSRMSSWFPSLDSCSLMFPFFSIVQ